MEKKENQKKVEEVLGEEEEEHVVEKALGCVAVNCRVEYLLKWKGFSDEPVHGNQKRNWIVPTSLLSFYSHR
jgi:uncharacterized protein (DUF4213/DUF364 family)